MVLGLIKLAVVLGAVGFSAYYLIYETDIIERYYPVRDSVTGMTSDMRTDIPGADSIVAGAENALASAGGIVGGAAPDEPAVLYSGMPYEVCMHGECTTHEAVGSRFFGAGISGLPDYEGSPRGLELAYEIRSGDSVVVCKPNGSCFGPARVQEGPADEDAYMLNGGGDEPKWDPAMVGPDGEFGTADDAPPAGGLGVCVLVDGLDPRCTQWP